MITITNFVKNTLLIALIAVTNFSFAQEESTNEPKISITGSVDAYYRANLSAPNDENAIAPGSSFANLPGFSLGMANFIAAYEGEKVGFVADLVFGPRGADAVFGTPTGSANIINQMYVYWNVSESVKLTFGNFNTFLGYEVISPTANFNYSTSYLFSYGPFSHAGLKADFDLGNDWSGMLAVMNPTDATTFNPTGKYAFGAQLGYSGQYLNFITDDGAFEIDYTGGFQVSEALYLGLNAAYFDNDGTGFAGAALYPQYTTSENFTIGLRGEYFAESGVFQAIDAASNQADTSVFALTLTGSATIGDLTLKPELRLDNASEEAFIDSDLTGTKNLSSFVLAAIYTF